MMALVDKLITGSWSWSEFRFAAPRPAEPINNDPMIGEYRADYSRLTPAEIAQEDPELTELYANSVPVSR